MFAIKNLTKLLSDDGRLSEPRPETTPSTGNDVSISNKTKHGCDDTEGGQPSHDDDSTVPTLDSSSSSPTFTIFETPTKAGDDESRGSVGGEVEEGPSFPISADDIEADQFSATAIEDTVAPTTLFTDTTNEDKGKPEKALQEKVVFSLSTAGDGASETPTPSGTSCKAICGAADDEETARRNTGYSCTVAIQSEIIGEKGGAKGSSHDGDGKATEEAEKANATSPNEAASRVSKEEFKNEAIRNVVDALDSSGVSSTTHSDSETARDGYSKLEKEDGPTSETPIKSARDANSWLSKAGTEPTVETSEGKLEQKFIQQEGSVKVMGKGNSDGTISEREDEDDEGREGKQLTAVIETTMELDEDKHEKIASKITSTASGGIVGGNDTMATVEKDTLPESTSDKSSLTLAQRMKEMFDSSSPDQPSNAFGKFMDRTLAPFSEGKQYVETDPQKHASLVKDMKVMNGSSPDKSSNSFDKTTTRYSVSFLASKEVLVSADSPKPFSGTKDMKAIFDSPSPNEPSKAFGIRKGKEEPESSKPLSLAKEMKAMFDSPSLDKPSKAFGVVKEDGAALEPVSLAKDMKAIFDSPSPDAPSRAFGAGKGEDSKPASLTRNMKAIFDSPFSDRPSRAFGVGKGTTRKTKKAPIAVAKTRCTIDMGLVGQQMAERKPTQSDSPVSVADQMVSLLWASSTPMEQTSLVEEKSFTGAGYSVIRDTVMEEGEDEDIEEITVEDEDVDGYDKVAHICDDDNFEEIIEEVIIDDERSKGGMTVSTEDEIFEGKARVEVSLDLTDVVVEKGNSDECSYDEVTADDSEYEEKTVGDDDAIVLREEQNDEIGSKEWVEEKSKSKIDETRTTIKKTHQNSLHSPSNEIAELLQQPKDDANKKLVVDAKGSANEECIDKGQYVATSTVDRSAPMNEARMNLSPTIGQKDSYNIDSLRVQKLNPRLLGDQSASGTLAEKLKIFDPPRASSDQPRVNKFEQSWRNPTPLIEPSSVKATKKTLKENRNSQNAPVVLPVLEPRATKVRQLNIKPFKTPLYCEEDEILVQEIISVVKEPGAMFNKQVLAERIIFLLTGKDTEGANVTAAKPLLQNHHWNIRQHSYTKTNYTGASAYSDRKKDGFKDSGLKQMRKKVEIQRGILNHIDDPDTIPNRKEKRTCTKERKEEIIKTEEQKEEPSVKSTTKSAFDKSPKVINAEEIIARIWPKTPDGEAKRETKSFSSLSTTSKRFSFDSPRKKSNGLGDRLKMFQTPSRSPVASSPTKSMGTGDNHTLIGPCPKAFARNIDCDNNNQMTTASIENVSGKKERSDHQISKTTLKGLVCLQRLWRAKRKSKFGGGHRNPSTIVLLQKRKNIVSKRALSLASTAASFRHNNIGNTPPPQTSQEIENKLSIPTCSHQAESPATASTSLVSSEPSTDAGSAKDSDDSLAGDCYSLEDLEQDGFDPRIVDMKRWEWFLTNESFYEHFGLTKDEFYKQPKWKRDKQKRKVRVAF